MALKKEQIVFGLLGVAGLFVLWYLWKESQNQGSGPSYGPPADASGNTPAIYPPNPAPVDLQNLPLPASPPNLVYNVPIGGYDPNTLRVAQASGGCCEKDCEPAGLATTVQTLPKNVLEAATSNLQSFMEKAGPVSHIEAGAAKAARAIFGVNG